MPAFIDDGFTSTGFIRANETHEAVTFEFRPATRSEVSAWRTHRDIITGEEVGKRDAAFIASHLVSWDVRYLSGRQAGSLVPISPENCGRLATLLAGRLIEIICLCDAGDTRPGQSAPESLSLEASAKN